MMIELIISIVRYLLKSQKLNWMIGHMRIKSIYSSMILLDSQMAQIIIIIVVIKKNYTQK